MVANTTRTEYVVENDGAEQKKAYVEPLGKCTKRDNGVDNSRLLSKVKIQLGINQVTNRGFLSNPQMRVHRSQTCREKRVCVEAGVKRTMGSRIIGALRTF